jgi:hypothetical protein
MLAVAARIVLAGALIVAALMKLSAPRSSRAALAVFGLRGGVVQQVAWALLIGAELALAAGVLVGSAAAALAAAGLMAIFAAALLIALLRGHAGAPCACFGSRSRVSAYSVARAVLLAGAFAALPLLPGDEPTTEGWLAIGLAVALAGVAALSIAVLALAREIGMLRLRLGPGSALEILDEGPALGARLGLIERIELDAGSELALAVFVSEGCHVCRSLEPAIDSLAAEPAVAVGTFDEGAEALLWRALAIPGSPFALALDLDGTVLAKGTFNNLAQLESVLATAERRRGNGVLAGAARG